MTSPATMMAFLTGTLWSTTLVEGSKPWLPLNPDQALLSDWSFQLMASDLEWPCPATRSVYEQSGRYIPKNIIVSKVQMHRDWALLLTPRYRSGVPFTIGKVNLRTANKCRPRIAPFPCWEMHEEGSPDAIQNAVDIFLDHKGVLWVLDSGVVNTLDTPVRRASPKVWAFDADTGKLLKTINLNQLVCTVSRLQYLVVEYGSDGRAFLYISDAATRAIIVWNVADASGYRVVLPTATTMDCGRRDVLYLALVKRPLGPSRLYFTYLSAKHLFAIDTDCLRRKSANGTVIDVGLKPTKFVLLGTDNGLNLFFRYRGQSDIWMWNTETGFKASNFIAVQEGGDCRLATQVLPGFRRLKWVLESNFHDYLAGTTGGMGANVRLHPLVKSGCDCF
ncbi:major royal jelly protein 5 [Nilaparvata lugens]|uniref:major royal jelly protein 5 n=1 Tax=Nilaparvata lugens TaxID=108931 RepID=UPI00193C9141|nr:major royal jelly protein 5 [Nilaparvata lugens]